MSFYLVIIILIVVLEFVWSQYLSYRNRKQMSPIIPPQLSGIYSDEEYAKQQEYQKTNSQFGLYSSLVSFVVLLIVLLTGTFGWLDQLIRTCIDNEIVVMLIFFGIIYMVSWLMSLPFDYYATFNIEERFGFNKSTPATFWADQLKGILLTAVIGGLLLTLLAWFYSKLGSTAWLYAWAAVTIFSLFMTLFYSNFIVPLFNKQTPLESGELRDAIEAFGKKAGFDIANIYVIDASKRSTKANAYFTGLGAKKRIVLYDTLINDLTTEQIVAVLAHEIGHYKKRHTAQGLILSIISTGIMLFLLSLMLNNLQLAEALGGKQPSFQLGLIAFSILFTPISFAMGIFTNLLSRRNEYQADAFAASFGLGKALVEGLKKLSVKSLSNLNPDNLYVFFNYSHPTLLQRAKALTQQPKRDE